MAFREHVPSEKRGTHNQFAEAMSVVNDTRHNWAAARSALDGDGDHSCRIDVRVDPH